MGNTVGSLTQFQKSVIIGSILGDGYLRIVPKRKNAFLEINHSFNQKDYVDWKYLVLKDVSASPPKMRRGNGHQRIAYRFYTKQSSILTAIYRRFYQNGKKTIPQNITLDPISLAVWFMDDGSKCRKSDVYLNTQKFNADEQKILIHSLRKLGLEAAINKDKIYFRLRFRKSSLPKLEKILQKNIIPSMKYKIEL